MKIYKGGWRKAALGAGMLVATLAIGMGASPALASPSTAEAAVTPATASGSSGLGTSEDEIFAVWDQYDVPAAVQAVLMDKIKAGQPLDSMTGVEPTSTETYNSAATQVSVSRYADGSIAITTIEDLSMARSVQNCTVNATTYAQNCEVNGWWGPVQLAFFSSYTKRDGQASVYNWYGGTFICGPFTTCSGPKFQLVRQNQSGALPAQINLYTDWNTGVANGRQTLSLFAKDRGAYTN